MKKIMLIISIVVVSIITILTARHYWPKPVLATAEKPNVIIISVDTLAANHLGTYGYSRNTSPYIDAFAKSGIQYNKAYTALPCTFPSYVSLFTGKYPNNNKNLDNNPDSLVLNDKEATLAESFKASGYKTAGFVSNGLLNPKKDGVNRGFETYDGVDKNDKQYAIRADGLYTGQRGDRTTEEASNWLDKNANSKFLLLVQYADPHAPYGKDEPFAGRFSEASDDKTLSQNNAKQIDLVWNNTATPAQIENLKNLYDEDVAYTDTYIGKLLDKINVLGLEKNTIIIFTADHGESFDHNYLGHCERLYESSVNVPLIIYDPLYAGKAKTSDELISLIDIYPTLKSRLSLKSESSLGGVDISGTFTGGEISRENVYTMTMPPWDKLFGHLTAPRFLGQMYATITKEQKIIYNETSGNKEIYNVSTDPQELTDESAILNLGNYEKLLLWINKYPIQKVNTTKSEEYYKQLKSLGYL